jgi:hypothetical protein
MISSGMKWHYMKSPEQEHHPMEEAAPPVKLTVSLNVAYILLRAALRIR